MEDILYPIIEHYIGAKVSKIKRSDIGILFITELGENGIIEKNVLGDWDLSINEEKVAEIEDILFSIFCEAKYQPPIDKYYKDLVGIKNAGLKYRSNLLVEQLIASLEYLVLTADVKLKSPINIGPFYAFSYNNRKEVIVLN